MISDKSITDFWNWFAGSKSRLRIWLDENDASALDRVITPRLKKLDSGLRWEIGPGKCKPYSFTVWCGGKRKLRAETERIIRNAPVEVDWEFYASRQPREIPKIIRVGDTEIQSGNWRFLAVENIDAKRLDIIVLDKNFSRFTDDEVLHAIFIYLDSALGEDAVEDWIGNIEFSTDARNGHSKEMHTIGELVASRMREELSNRKNLSSP